MANGGKAQLVSVAARLMAERGVDHEVDLAVCDHVEDAAAGIGVALGLANLKHALARNTCCGKRALGAGRRYDLEAKAAEIACNRHDVALVTVGNANENSSDLR